MTVFVVLWGLVLLQVVLAGLRGEISGEAGITLSLRPVKSHDAYGATPPPNHFSPIQYLKECYGDWQMLDSTRWQAALKRVKA